MRKLKLLAFGNVLELRQTVVAELGLNVGL